MKYIKNIVNKDIRVVLLDDNGSALPNAPIIFLPIVEGMTDESIEVEVIKQAAEYEKLVLASTAHEQMIANVKNALSLGVVKTLPS